MKKVLVAMQNETLLGQLKKCGKYIVYNYDLDNKETVIEYLKRHEVDVLITKDVLDGNISKNDYIKEIRKQNQNIKIIICVNKLDEEYKGFLLANNVTNIIEGDEVTFSKITEMIESKTGIISFKEEKLISSKPIKSTVNVITKQKVAVFGTSGAGKSYIASVLAEITSKKFKLNTMLVDMDIQNAAIDIYNNLTNSTNSLQYLMEEIDRDSFNQEIFLELANKSNKNAKLSFITNNMGIYECQNKISETYYSKLYKEAENNYDLLILDLPATPFLDVVPFTLNKVDKVVFVLNPNFISIRQAIKYLDLITSIWKVRKDKIFIIVNKLKKDSLSVRQIEGLLKEYNVLLSIKDDEKVERIINGLDTISIDDFDNFQALSSMLGIEHENEKVTKRGRKNDNKCIYGISNK